MSNLSLPIESKINDKVIIEDDSDDSFDSYCAINSYHMNNSSRSNRHTTLSNHNSNTNLSQNSSSNVDPNLNLQPVKKSFINKIKENIMNDPNNLDKEIIVKNKKNTKIKSNYNRKNYTLVNKTKEILEKSYVDYQNSLQEYYQDVLKWMNLLYNDQSKSIAKIKFIKMTLNEEIFNLYNEIVKKYKLNKDLFDTSKFYMNDDHERTEIFLISKILTNNLLAKLGYKLIECKSGNAKRLKISNTINCY
jgi:hypothetical protein